MRRIAFLIMLTGCAVVMAGAQTIHRLGVAVRPVYVIPTHRFLMGENQRGTPIERSWSIHLQYGFQNPRHTYAPTAWQGIGVSHHRFLYDFLPSDGGYYPAVTPYNPAHELGNPTAFYLFQGATIVRLGPRLSLDYEWNFGLSFGWVPYHFPENDYNKVIGSKVNAYLNSNFYLNCTLSPTVELTGGISLTHFSNGSTRLPNAGLNTAGLAFGAVYNFNRMNGHASAAPLKKFDIQQHMSYETVLFGAWRKKGVQVGEHVYGSPHTYAVAGFNFAAMYNWGHKVRLGASLDGVYDGSANIHVDEQIITDGWQLTDEDFKTPPPSKQWALGLAAQVDYVMPYFTLTLGFGANVLHGGGELDSFYQRLALKIGLTPRTFLHIGYSLREFRAPNFLMLGVGFRFRS